MIKNKKKILIITAIGILLTTIGVFGLNGFFGGGASIPSDTMTRGLVGYWNLDEGKGTTTADISGNNNTGVFLSTTTSPAWTAGKIGGALSFNGTTTYVNVGTPSSLNFDGMNNITIMFWMKAAATQATFMDPMSWYHTATSGIVFQSTDSGATLDFLVGNGSGIPTAGSYGDLRDNTWHHLVAVKSSAGAFIYLDGKLKASNTAMTAPISLTGNWQVNIGRDANARYLNGLMDEVRVFNRALTAEEIRYAYNRGGPVGYWKIDEGNGTTTYDSSGNGNNGVMTNMQATTSWTSGKYGNALSFDGVNDYVEVPDNSQLRAGIMGSFTWTAWVRGIYSTVNPGLVIKSNEYMIQANGRWIYAKVYDGASWEASGYSSWYGAVDGLWYHVTSIFTGGNSPRLKLYINGELKSDVAWSGTLQSTTGKIYVGTITPTYGPFNGLIDDVRIYNYARTPDEIKLDYNAGFAASFGPQSDCDRDPGSCMTKGLAGYWSFDEGRGTTTADISGNNNTGIFASTTTSPAWTKGKIGGALSFNNTTTYVAAGSGISYTTFPGMTLETWIKRAALGSRDYIVSAGYSPYQFEIWNSNVVGIEIQIDSVYYNLVSSSAFTSTDWAHLVFAHTLSSGVWNIYVNGSVFASGVATGTAYTGGGVTRIGNHTGSADGPFDGLIDEVKIYNRALSPTEVRYHYNKGGPMAYWKFDEGNGLTAYDSSGNGNTGTLQNNMATTSWTSGKYGNALSFDGVNDYALVSDSNSLDATLGITVGGWIKLDTIGAITRRVISKDQAYELSFSNTNQINLSIYIDGEWRGCSSGSSAVTLGQWHYVMGRYDSTDRIMKIYVNGAEVKSCTLSGLASYTINAAGTGLYIGQAGSQFFAGLMDDIRIYNYARTPEQILQDYNAGFAVSFGPQSDCDRDPGSCMTKGLAGYWSLDEGRGTTTADISGNNNRASSLTAAGTPQWTQGKVGSALSFDGVDDSIDQSTYNASLDLTTTYSLELWFKSNTSVDYDGLLGKVKAATDGAIAIYRPTSNILRFHTYDGVGYVGNDISTNVWDNIWHHAVITVNNSISQWYLDGKASGTPVDHSSRVPYSGAGTELWRIGKYQPTNDYALAIIDEVRIYNRVLSAAEVRYHYNKGGPVGYWKFDEGSATTTFDSSGNNNPGYFSTTSTSPAWVQGKYGSALNFDGVNDYVKMGHNSIYNFGTTGDFTWEFWVNPSLVGTRLFYKDPNWAISASTGSKFFFRVWQSVSNYASLTSSVAPKANVWYHLVTIRRGSSLEMYINGVRDTGASLVSVGTGVNSDIDSTQAIYIGSEGGSANWWGGSVDEVRIYNYARTPEQILQDYNGGFNIHFK